MGFIGIHIRRSVSSNGWLLFFLASLGMAQEQAVLNYWWIMPEDTPAKAPRVIRVLGEKGEAYEELYTLERQARLENGPEIVQARLARQEALRREAMELMRQLKSVGKSPEVAYEEAWTQVYRNNWLSANWKLGSCKLEDMLLRMASDDAASALTPEEQQWVLEALLEDDDRLESEAGRELLRRLTQRLRAMGYGKLYAPNAANDQVMKRFADALSTGMDSMAAYREAMFTTHRDRVGQHTLRGYVAPWGIRVGGPRYHQAPQKVGVTEGSASGLDAALAANPQPGNQLTATDLNEVSAAEKDFLAVSPEDEKKEKDENKNEQEDELVKQGESTASAMAAAPAPIMRSFSLRGASSPAAVAESPEFTWSGAGSNEWPLKSESGTPPWQGGAEYVDGSSVGFDDSGASREVRLTGVVAPGSITVSANNAAGSSGTTNVLNYGYAFTGSGSIADITDSTGKIIQATSISNTGSALLILDTANTFSGGVSLAEGASLYIGCDGAAGTGTITMADKSKLIVNYQTDDLFFRTPSLSNSLKVNGDVEVTSGTTAYGEDRLTADWRTLTLSGGVSGSGTLTLCGYSYMVKPTLREDREITLNYVSAIAVNEKNAAAGAAANRFSGTVSLKNEFNYQSSNTAEVPLFGNKSKHVAGALQLTLVDDVFAQAHLNLTRDETPDDVNRQAGENQGGDGRLGPSVTTDNILLLSENQKITLKSLDAAFLGHTFTYSYQNDQNQNSYKLVTSYRADYPQAYERWHVRVVTDGYTTLVLDDDSKTDHVFSGSMGFAHSYTTSSEAYIHAPNLSGKNEDSNIVEPNMTTGDWSLGLELLSLEKQGAAAQYIHTANLQNLALYEGVLGFNYLSVSGKLAVNAGSVLKLGVVESSDNPTDWVKTSASGSYDKETIGTLTSAFTNTTLTVGSGQLNVSTDSSQQAIVQGGLTLGTQAAGSSLSFDISGVMPSTTKSSTSTILDVQGALTLWETTLVNIDFANINLSEYYDPKTTYYLVSADSITINKDSLNPKAAFNGQFVSLGSGYYGKLSIVSGSGSDKHTYLALNVVGDPRRTWSGMVSGNYTWTTGDSSKTKWKENRAYENGLLTLFGNLYQPVEWDGTKELDSYQTVHVLDGKEHAGSPVAAAVTGFAIDGRPGDAIGFQKVKLEGKVLPAAIFIGSDYNLHSSAGDAGVSTDDDTNYYFYGDGFIGEAGASGDNVLVDTAFKGGSTSLRKMGYGTAVIATNNTFKGGTVLEGGRLVMQHYHALGTGGVTIFNATTAQDKRPNIPVLQGDFSDTDREAYEKAGGKSDPHGWVTRIGSGNVSAYDGEHMTTSTIHNPVTIILQTDSTTGGADTERVDARIANSHDRKMVLKQLSGPKGSIVSLYGTSVEATGKAGEQYTYAVFKVLDPKNFYGTIKMDGNLWGKPEGTDGGNVQMEIMTVDKSDNGADWLNTTVDLSIRNGTNRTVLALDAHGGADKPAEQIAQLDALHGRSADGSRINSSVVSMSHEKTVIFELEGLTSGDYDGVLGFGDFQKTVDYHSAQSSSLTEGTVAHHYGGVGKDGVLNVLKKGASVQSVYAAWLNQLSVEGGAFVVDEALVVSDLKNAVASHVIVGRTRDDALYGLTVTAGGILAIDQPSGDDAFGNVGAGVAEHWKEVVVGDNIKLVAVPESSYVLFDDGATITGHSDWKTTRGYGKEIEGHKEVFMNIASGATVTFNTHNYTPDETINSTNNKFGSYDRSYVIQLLGEMQGRGVHLVF